MIIILSAMIISNSEVARILREIGEYLEMQDVPFKPRAYEKAALAVGELEEQAGDLYKQGGLKALEDIPGVGVSIAEKIEELLRTGRVKYYEALKKKAPVNLSELTAVEGLGPKSIKKLYQKLGITGLKELEKAARAGKIGTLEGFGKKSEEKILAGIGFLKRAGGRFLLGDVLPLARMLEERLKGVAGVEKAIVAGSVRRKKETIGDIDILVVSKGGTPAFAKAASSAEVAWATKAGSAGKVMDYVVRMPEVARVIAHGATKSSVKLSTGLNVDVRVVAQESYGAALNYFTGSKDHNVALRKLALQKGYTLNEYGLFKITDSRGLHTDQPRSRASSLRGTHRNSQRRSVLVAGATEEELYRALGLDYIEPEMRENTGEIALAGKHNLPKLINYGDVKGDLQVQTSWTDGAASIEEMAIAAAKVGLKYIAITDHTQYLAVTHGLDEKRILKQMAEIDRLNRKLSGRGVACHILTGTECDIHKDGSLDLSDTVLSRLDVVGVSVHSYFKLSRQEQTARVIHAMENPHVDILFHLTGRLINKREPIDVDIDAIIAAAKRTGTILEINASPDRLDLKDEYIRKCVGAGVKMIIDSDAHAADHFKFLEYGVAQARRGWATRGDVINAWPLKKMLRFLKKRK